MFTLFPLLTEVWGEIKHVLARAMNYFVIPVGWIVQSLLIFVTVFLAIYGMVFPLLSFSLACAHAIIHNRCSNVVVIQRKHPERTIEQLWNATHALFDEECFGTNDTPLNLFRSTLFVFQLLGFVAVLVYQTHVQSIS